MLKEMTRERMRSRESGVRTESTHAQNYDDAWARTSEALELKCGLIAALGGWGRGGGEEVSLQRAPHDSSSRLMNR